MPQKYVKTHAKTYFNWSGSLRLYHVILSLFFFNGSQTIQFLIWRAKFCFLMMQFIFYLSKWKDVKLCWEHCARCKLGLLILKLFSSVAVKIMQQIFAVGDALSTVTALFLEIRTLILFSNIRAAKHVKSSWLGQKQFYSFYECSHHKKTQIPKNVD